jgi:hypoxanthine phosphoribosyltransferase
VTQQNIINSGNCDTAMTYLYKDLSDVQEKDLKPFPQEYLPVIPSNYREGIAGLLVTEEDRKQCIDALAAEITKDYRQILAPDEALVCIPMLNGAMYLAAELSLKIRLPCEIDTFKCETYGGGTVSDGEIKLNKDLSRPVKGRHVLLVEDVVDTGNTMDYIIQFLGRKKAASVGLVTFLDKKPARKIYVQIQYAGFRIPDMFVLGYGLDINHLVRNLPVVAIYSDRKK